MNKIKILTSFFLVFFLSSYSLLAAAAIGGDNKSSSLPRLASIKFSNVNGRSGPSKNHPIIWVYQKQYEPVKIISEFEHWRQIQDYENDKSWVHSSMLAQGKYTIIDSKYNRGTKMYRTPLYEQKYRKRVKKKQTRRKHFAYIMNKVRCKIIRCKDNNWCKIKCQNVKGWVSSSDCFGLR